MKCVCLKASPRKKGNSAILAEHFTSTAQSHGAEVQTYVLNELTFKGCQACFACKTGQEQCVVQDDLQPVLQAIQDSACVLLASPVYFGDVSAQAKAFIDRSFSFLKPDFKTSSQPGRLSGDKHLVFILTQGQPDENMFNDIYPKYSNFMQWEGFAHTHLLRGCGLQEAGEVRDNKVLLAQTEKLAQEICG